MGTVGEKARIGLPYLCISLRARILQDTTSRLFEGSALLP